MPKAHSAKGGEDERQAIPRDEIQAELDDHLSTTAEQISRQGVRPEQARRQAEQRFGDAEQIGRKCWWIQNGDDVMFRIAAVVLLVLLSAGLIGLAFGGWHVQSSFTQKMDDLNKQLADMNDTQRTLLAEQNKQTPLQINGRLYVGDRSRAAAGVEVVIGRLPDNKIVRRLRSDERGRFQTQPLPSGDYFVVAPLIGPANERPFYVMQSGGLDRLTPRYHVQSQTLYLYPGAEPPSVELDLKFRSGDIEFELARDFPEKIEENGRSVSISLVITVYNKHLKSLPWDPSSSLPPKDWPIMGFAFGDFEYKYSNIVVPQGSAENGLKLKTARFGHPQMFRDLPSGEYLIDVYVHASATHEQLGMKTTAEDTAADSAAGFGGLAGSGGFSGMMAGRFGSPASISGIRSYIAVEKSGFSVDLDDGGAQRIRIIAPTDFEQNIRNLLKEEELDVKKLQSAFGGQAKVEVVAH